jgi:hypothetical protein
LYRNIRFYRQGGGDESIKNWGNIGMRDSEEEQNLESGHQGHLVTLFPIIEGNI